MPKKVEREMTGLLEKGIKQNLFGAYFYLVLIMLFMSGVVVFRLLKKRTLLSAKIQTPIVIVCVLVYEVLTWRSFSKAEKDNLSYVGHFHREHLFVLAPMFGMIDCLVLKDGLKSLPWCTTGHVISIGYTLTDMALGEASREDIRKCSEAICMLIAMVLGAFAASLLEFITPRHFNFEMAWITPVLIILLFINDNAFRLRPLTEHTTKETLATDVVEGRTDNTPHMDIESGVWEEDEYTDTWAKNSIRRSLTC